MSFSLIKIEYNKLENAQSHSFLFQQFIYSIQWSRKLRMLERQEVLFYRGSYRHLSFHWQLYAFLQAWWQASINTQNINNFYGKNYCSKHKKAAKIVVDNKLFWRNMHGGLLNFENDCNSPFSEQSVIFDRCRFRLRGVLTLCETARELRTLSALWK